jgi:hypothetical protein
MDALFEYLLKAIVYTFNVTVHWLRVCGTAHWPLANATVTAAPISSFGFACPSAEIVYAYRFQGELYTGIHEEPFILTDSLTDYVERFREGRSLVVRIKPGNPEVSVVCEGDQGAITQSQPEQLTA